MRMRGVDITIDALGDEDVPVAFVCKKSCEACKEGFMGIWEGE